MINSIKAIIVDDERLARINLMKLLDSHDEIEVVGEADSCKSALEIIKQCKPRLIFLDIQLGGETGFDLLEIIDNTIKIIFVTAFDEYAIRAFEINAVDYLLKPVNPDRLKASVERVLNKEDLHENVTKIYEYTDNIYVWLNNNTSRFIKISSIMYIEPVGNYSRIITIDGKHGLILKTLKQWQEELPAKSFIRIHRSCIINIEHVDHIEKSLNAQTKLFLKNIPEPFEVSRRFYRNLKTIK